MSISPLHSSRLLARNAFWNFAGMVAPMFVALFAIPALIDGMGKERFGLLAIIWMFVGYFSLFDMGLGRALTKLIAERLARGEFDDLPNLVWTALWIVLGLGGVGLLVLLIAAEPLVVTVLNVPTGLQEEALLAVRILAFSIPLVVVTAALIGLLEAHQQFMVIAAVRIPLGVINFAGPLVTLTVSPSLVPAIVFLLAARIIAFAIYFVVACRKRPELKAPRAPCRTRVRILLSFGGWLTVSNIVGPMMVYFDRFVIGALLSLSAVTYYVTPYEVISRLQIVSVAIVGVLFPAVTASIASDRSRLATLYYNGARVLLLLILPVACTLFLLAPEGLEFWLGKSFREEATSVVRWLVLGVLINAIARMLMITLQGAGRPDLTAKTHLLELFPYAVAIWFLTTNFGITGAAATWCLRMLMDALVLSYLTAMCLPELKTAMWSTVILWLLLTGSLPVAAFWLDSVIWRILLAVFVCSWAAWKLRPVLQSIIRDGESE